MYNKYIIKDGITIPAESVSRVKQEEQVYEAVEEHHQIRNPVADDHRAAVLHDGHTTEHDVSR